MLVMKMKELDKINADNETKVEGHEEVVNMLAEEEVKFPLKGKMLESKTIEKVEWLE